jgi:cellulose biosynthesis protein BcsQ
MSKPKLVRPRDLLPGGRRNPLILAMVLAKGGTAKTTSTTIIGTILALYGYVVRIFDLDAQCNASEILGRKEEDRDPGQQTVWDLIQGLCTLEEATVPAQYRQDVDEDGNPVFAEIPNMYVVHGDMRLTDTDILMANKPQRFYWFANLINQYKTGALEARENEIWLLDLPANYGKLTLSALLGLTEDDEVIPPMLVTSEESGALEKLFRALLDMQEEFQGGIAPASPSVKHVLLCSTPTTKHDAEEYVKTVEEVERDYPGMVLPYVRYSGVVASQYRKQCTTPIFAPKSAPSRDYTDVVHALGFHDLTPEE